MGFRSTFITEDTSFELPDWFFDKYKHIAHFNEFDGKKYFPISSKHEEKTYNLEIEADLQKVLIENNPLFRKVILLWLHECGGITRVEIYRHAIIYSEPDGWNIEEYPTHSYCYGCSDIAEAERWLTVEIGSDNRHPVIELLKEQLDKRQAIPISIPPKLTQTGNCLKITLLCLEYCSVPEKEGVDEAWENFLPLLKKELALTQ